MGSAPMFTCPAGIPGSPTPLHWNIFTSNKFTSVILSSVLSTCSPHDYCSLIVTAIIWPRMGRNSPSQREQTACFAPSRTKHCLRMVSSICWGLCAPTTPSVFGGGWGWWQPHSAHHPPLISDILALVSDSSLVSLLMIAFFSRSVPCATASSSCSFLGKISADLTAIGKPHCRQPMHTFLCCIPG